MSEWEYTAQHYRNHTAQRVDLRERRRGPAFPLKDFHNTVKRDLIRTFSGGATKLLDLGCGRGGDIRKWLDETRLQYVKGIDLSGDEIEEAKIRFKDIMRSNKYAGRDLDADFEQCGTVGVSPLPPDPRGPYDAVSCMFVAHYFFVTEQAAKMFLSNVSQSLRDGGYFFGCCPDGKEILMLLKENDTYREPMLTIKKKWKTPQPECFGSAFTLAISDTVTDATGDGDEGSYEYLVFFNVFIKIAERYNLYPVKEYPPTVMRHFKKEDANLPFKHFMPNFPDAQPGLHEASALNVAFAFQKRLPGSSVGSQSSPKNVPLPHSSHQPQHQVPRATSQHPHSQPVRHPQDPRRDTQAHPLRAAHPQAPPPRPASSGAGITPQNKNTDHPDQALKRKAENLGPLEGEAEPKNRKLTEY